MRPLAMTAAALLVSASIAAAQSMPPPPPPLPGTLVTHNGSLMSATAHGPHLTIRYVDPRPAMRPFVVPGTVLVDGRWISRNEFAGVSHSYWCGRAYPYAVSGGVDATGALVLQGPAPIIDPFFCGVLGYEWTGNSTLRFEPYAAPQSLPFPRPMQPRAPPPSRSFPPISNGEGDPR